MGALFGGSSVPAVAAVPPAANPATTANATIGATANQANARAAAAAGASSTVTNSGGAGGLSAPATASKSLLGQ